MLSRREALLTTLLSPLTQYLKPKKKEITELKNVREKVAALHKAFQEMKGILYLRLNDGQEKLYHAEIIETGDSISVSMKNEDGTMQVQQARLLNSDLEVVGTASITGFPMCHGDTLTLHYTCNMP